MRANTDKSAILTLSLSNLLFDRCALRDGKKVALTTLRIFCSHHPYL